MHLLGHVIACVGKPIGAVNIRKRVTLAMSGVCCVGISLCGQTCRVDNGEVVVMSGGLAGISANGRVECVLSNTISAW